MQNLAMLYRVAKRYTRDAQLAEDLVGQTLLSVTKAWDKFDGKNTRGWMIKILHNSYLGHVRYQSSRIVETSHEEDIVASTYDLSQDTLNRITTDAILRSIDDLPEEYRLAVTLCDVEQLDYQEAAEALDVPVGTVKSRLFRGRKLLQQRLGGYAQTL